MNATGRDPADRFRVLAVTASAGGVQALSALIDGLPGDFPIPVLVVQHLDPRHQTILAQILDRRSVLRVRLAEAGERIVRGTVYVAPPDQHLLVDGGGVLSLSDGPRTHFVRPAADVLFASVAEAFGPRALVCVLTGTGRDGATGVGVVKEHGGTVIAEDPATAAFPGMPDATVRTGHADLVAPLHEIPAAINELLVATRQ